MNYGTFQIYVGSLMQCLRLIQRKLICNMPYESQNIDQINSNIKNKDVFKRFFCEFRLVLDLFSLLCFVGIYIVNHWHCPVIP